MPHIFKVVCYDNHIKNGKAKVGDTVYLKSQTDFPMTVHDLLPCNFAAGHRPRVGVTHMNSEGHIMQQNVDAVLLTL